VVAVDINRLYYFFMRYTLIKKNKTSIIIFSIYCLCLEIMGVKFCVWSVDVPLDSAAILFVTGGNKTQSIGSNLRLCLIDTFD
jgi:hypothetical protein